jgi:hypothetical protein
MLQVKDIKIIKTIVNLYNQINEIRSTLLRRSIVYQIIKHNRLI